MPSSGDCSEKMGGTGLELVTPSLSNAITRTLFEVYASLALNTVEYNSFETH